MLLDSSIRSAQRAVMGYRRHLRGDAIPPWVAWLVLALLVLNILRALFF